MARIKVHSVCRLPLSECICPDDDEVDEPEFTVTSDEDEVA